MKKLIIAEQLKKLRKEKKWTLKQAAKKLGVDYRTLQRYEKGESYPPADIINTCCTTFKVSLDYLFYGDEVSDTALYQQIEHFSSREKKFLNSIIKFLSDNKT